MAGLLTHIERSLAVDVDLDLEPQCESEYHDGAVQAWFPQAHGGPATHYQVTPCGHYNGLRCTPHVNAIRAAGGGHCDLCGPAQNNRSNYRFIEL